ncbi:MAG: hypothetical protein QM758_17065 [Armatimonas sp.]
MTEEELDSLASRWHADARASHTLKRSPRLASGQTLLWMPIAALAASGLVAVGVISLSSKPLPAFAEVEKGLKAVQTAQWEEVAEEYDEKGKRVFQAVSQISIRRNPAVMLRVQISPAKEGKGGKAQDLFTTDSNQTYSPWGNKLIVLARNAEQKKEAPSYVSFLLESQTIAPNERANSERARRSSIPWKAQRVSNELMFERENTNKGTRFASHFRERVWVDPKTLQVIRSEELKDNLTPPRTRSILRCRNIRYNPVLPDSLFRIVTRPDTVIVHQPPRMHKAALLSEKEKGAILPLLQKTISAWNQGDADGFCKNWDFAFRNRSQLVGAEPASEREKQWCIRVKNHVSWAAPLKSPVLRKFSWTNIVGPEDVLPKGKVLQVGAGSAVFMLSQQAGKWKIVDMHYELQKR